MKTLFAAFLIVFLSGSIVAQVCKLKGHVGTYPIEMELENGDSTNTIKGKYNYKGKKSFLSLKGELYDNVMHMEESFNGKTTGEFFLQRTNGDSLGGKWVQGTKSYDVTLIVVENDEAITYYGTEEKSATASDGVDGTYEVEWYFLNDMWFEEGKPDIEVGFNGGTAVIKQLDDKRIQFLVEAICGPTYHFAFASGEAIQTEEKPNEYIYTNEDGCEIQIILGEKEVSMSSYQQMECGFGARAYLEHSFVKISDETNFDVQGY